jgi:hypothetical protein
MSFSNRLVQEYVIAIPRREAISISMNIKRLLRFARPVPQGSLRDMGHCVTMTLWRFCILRQILVSNIINIIGLEFLRHHPIFQSADSLGGR